MLLYRRSLCTSIRDWSTSIRAAKTQQHSPSTTAESLSSEDNSNDVPVIVGSTPASSRKVGVVRLGTAWNTVLGAAAAVDGDGNDSDDNEELVAPAAVANKTKQLQLARQQHVSSGQNLQKSFWECPKSSYSQLWTTRLQMTMVSKVGNQGMVCNC